ncbi:hypothetical protein ACH42_03525 [Endozoicomonas sp. (ex Bugula neritina AB1)]|nr:hypothetical protein ACH42_03525 [Endozoicomonas sp. (ex Bugula neritina AB1)]
MRWFLAVITLLFLEEARAGITIHIEEGCSNQCTYYRLGQNLTVPSSTQGFRIDVRNANELHINDLRIPMDLIEDICPTSSQNLFASTTVKNLYCSAVRRIPLPEDEDTNTNNEELSVNTRMCLSINDLCRRFSAMSIGSATKEQSRNNFLVSISYPQSIKGGGCIELGNYFETNPNPRCNEHPTISSANTENDGTHSYQETQKSSPEFCDKNNYKRLYQPMLNNQSLEATNTEEYNAPKPVRLYKRAVRRCKRPSTQNPENPENPENPDGYVGYLFALPAFSPWIRLYKHYLCDAKEDDYHNKSFYQTTKSSIHAYIEQDSMVYIINSQLLMIILLYCTSFK